MHVFSAFNENMCTMSHNAGNIPETRNFEIALESVELSFTGKVYLRDRPCNIMEGGGLSFFLS